MKLITTIQYNITNLLQWLQYIYDDIKSTVPNYQPGCLAKWVTVKSWNIAIISHTTLQVLFSISSLTLCYMASLSIPPLVKLNYKDRSDHDWNIAAKILGPESNITLFAITTLRAWSHIDWFFNPHFIRIVSAFVLCSHIDWFIQEKIWCVLIL